MRPPDDRSITRAGPSRPPAASSGETGRTVHRYRSSCEWSGSTAAGYERYDRTHRLAARPAGAGLDASADGAFRGDPSRLNPEQLVVMAASSCQLLSFLAVAARAHLDVVAYRDDAEADMPESSGPMALREIRLHPVITLRGTVSEERIRQLVEVAHRECFIANTLRCPVVVVPTVVTT